MHTYGKIRFHAKRHAPPSDAPDPAVGPENVENNEQLRLFGRNLEGRTPLWKHDSVWIRAPAQFVRWFLTTDNILHDILRIIVWFCLFATLLGAAIIIVFEVGGLCLPNGPTGGLALC
jgi:hypothetical protein